MPDEQREIKFNPRMGTAFQKFVSTIPENELEAHSDFLELRGNELSIRQSLGQTSVRRHLQPQIYDDTTPWFETQGASYGLGLTSRLYRQISRSVLGAFGDKTAIDQDGINQYFRDNAEQLSEGIRLRKARGRYNGISTKEALIRLLAHDLLMDEYEEKKAKGSFWAGMVGDIADLAVVDAATLGALHIGFVGIRKGLQMSRATTASLNTRKYLKASAAERRGKLEVLEAFTPGAPARAAWDTSIEAFAALGATAARRGETLGETTTLLSRLWGFNAVKGAARVGGAEFVQNLGIKLVDDDRTWGEIAEATKRGAMFGGVVGLVPLAAGLTGAGIKKLVGKRPKITTAEAAASKATTGKPTGTGVAKLDAAGVVVADLSKPLTFKIDVKTALSFANNAVTRTGMLIERGFGRFLLKNTTLTEEWAGLFAKTFRGVVWGSSSMGLLLRAGIPMYWLGLEGIIDKAKQIGAKEIDKQLRNASEEDGLFDRANPFTFRGTPNESDFFGFDAIETAIVDAREFEEYDPDFENEQMKVFMADAEAEHLADPLTQEENRVVVQMALASMLPLQESFVLAANDINDIDATPDEFRHCAKAYREAAKEVVYADSMTDMLMDLSYRVADGNDTLISEQAAIDYRFDRDIGHIDQTWLTGAVNEQGMGAVGNFAVRGIANGLASLLECRADDKLVAEVARINDDFIAWLDAAAGESYLDLAQTMARNEVHGIQWIGRHMDFENEEAFAYHTMLNGFNDDTRRRMMNSEEITDTDIEVAHALAMINAANMFSSFQTAMYETIPGQENQGPSRPDRYAVIQSHVETPDPEPSDLPSFRGPLQVTSDLGEALT